MNDQNPIVPAGPTLDPNLPAPFAYLQRKAAPGEPLQIIDVVDTRRDPMHYAYIVASLFWAPAPAAETINLPEQPEAVAVANLVALALNEKIQRDTAALQAGSNEQSPENGEAPLGEETEEDARKKAMRKYLRGR